MIEFLRSRKKHLLVSLVSTAGFLALFTYLSSNWMLVMTVSGQECFPYRNWVVKKSRDIHAGEYLAFWGHGIHNAPDKVLWGKKVLATGGDRIIAEKARGTGTIRVDGVDRPFPVQGMVRVYDRGGNLVKTLVVYGHDTFGRSLPMINSMIIPEGKYFVLGGTERSYDSRYWGFVDASWVVGRAYPVI